MGPGCRRPRESSIFSLLEPQADGLYTRVDTETVCQRRIQGTADNYRGQLHARGTKYATPEHRTGACLLQLRRNNGHVAIYANFPLPNCQPDGVSLDPVRSGESKGRNEVGKQVKAGDGFQPPLPGAGGGGGLKVDKIAQCDGQESNSMD